MEAAGLMGDVKPEEWIAGAVHAQRKAQAAMDFHVMIGNNLIDEVSILLKSVEAQERFLGWCIASGMKHIGQVEHDWLHSTEERVTHIIDDHTGRSLLVAHDDMFAVRFDFVKPPEAAWRIELVTVTDGTAPLHEQAAEGTAFHASFKCSSPEHYETKLRELRAWCRDSYPIRAEYQNSYGIFSYAGFAPPYLKPRVNLRDS